MPSDLLAVSFLGTPFMEPWTVRHLLSNPPEIVSLPRKIPDGPLWEVPESELDRDSAAWRFWDSLDALPGVGPTRVGKLMARKRRHLIPIVDDVVATFLLVPESEWWSVVRSYVLDQRRRGYIEALRPGDVSASVPTLRLLDAAIWMRYSPPALPYRKELGN